MAKDEKTAVDKTADAIMENDTFQTKLAEAIAGAISKSTQSTTKSNTSELFAPAHQESRPEIRSVLGGSIVALHRAKNDRTKAIEYSKQRWGDGNEVQKAFMKSLTSETTSGAVEMVQTTVADEVIAAWRLRS